MNNALVRLIGWKAIVLQADPCVFDRWRWLKRHLTPGPLRTLDAGSGSGAFTMYAATIGNESVGLSFEERNNRIARARAAMLGIPNVQFMPADLRDLDQIAARLGQFDQIICFETIEHIQNDKKLLTDLSVLLRPGGKLLLTTPYKHYRPLLGDRLSEHEDGGHVRWGYTHEEMRELFDQCGLDVLAAEYVSGLVSQQITNATRILSRMNARLAWAATFPLRVLQILDSPLTRLAGYPYLSIAVVGIKRS